MRGKDYRIGDVIKIQGCDSMFLVNSFFRESSTDSADRFFIFENEGIYGVMRDILIVPQQCIINTVDKTVFLRSNCCTLPTGGSGGSQMLLERHASLLLGGNTAKVAKQGMRGEFLKVMIAPIIFFTDDTSGGTSKQHISYESWSMTYTALPLENRGHRENSMFIGCVLGLMELIQCISFLDFPLT